MSKVDIEANNKPNLRKSASSTNGNSKNDKILVISNIKPKNLSKYEKFSFRKINFFRIDFFILKAKNTFIYLEKTFIKILFFHYFDFEYHIRIETNASNNTINRIFSQLTLD